MSTYPVYLRKLVLFQCEVDLVQIRCSAYKNSSLPHILEQENGVAVQGTIKLPEKKVQNPELDVNTPSSRGSLGN